MISGFKKRSTYTLPATSIDQADINYRFVVDYNSYMNLDFSDIRFYDNDYTLLKHDRFSYTSGTTATFWIKVPSVPAAGKVIYMYYGNSSLTDESDKNNVYVFWDNFRGDLSKWEGNTTIFTQIEIAPEKYLRSKIVWGNLSGYFRPVTPVYDAAGRRLIARFRHDYPSSANNFTGYGMAYTVSTSRIYNCIGAGEFFNWTRSGASIGGHFGDDVWGEIEIYSIASNNIKHYRNGVLDYTDTVQTISGSYNFQFATGGTSAESGYCDRDYIYIVQHASDGTEITDITTPTSEEDYTKHVGTHGRICICPSESLTNISGVTTKSLASEIGKKFYGSIEVSTLDGALIAADNGFKNKKPYYIEAPDTETSFSSLTEGDFIFIKNTGEKYIDHASKGEGTEYVVNVYVGGTLVSTLEKKAACWYSGNPSTFTVKTVGPDGNDISGTGNAIEWLILKEL